VVLIGVSYIRHNKTLSQVCTVVKQKAHSVFRIGRLAKVWSTSQVAAQPLQIVV